MNRREFLKLAITGVSSVSLGSACAVRSVSTAHRRGASKLVPVKVSWDRVIRTVVGLRPFRKHGWRIEKVGLDGKTLVHNYGHGGAGISLCWGSSHLAVEKTARMRPGRCAVIGCGALGLTTARLLQRKGWDVTIYAKELPPNTTSNVAGATWDGSPDPGFTPEDLRIASLSHEYFRNLLGKGYGVRWIDKYEEAAEEIFKWYKANPLKDLFPGFAVLDIGEHPFPWERAVRWRTLLIETPIYLRALMRDVRESGGRIMVREFEDQESVLALTEPVIFNCSGIGARALFGDDELIPIKGQFTILEPQPEVDYLSVAIPRRDGILIGGGVEVGVWSLEPNREFERLYMEGAMEFFGAMT